LYRGINKQEINEEKTKESLTKTYLGTVNYIHKIIKFDDYVFSLKELIKLYIIMKIVNFISAKFILLLIMNVIIFYAPIENKTDHFLFKGKMAVQQAIEGAIALAECLIPRYEGPK